MGTVEQGFRKKIEILHFHEQHGRWPGRHAEDRSEYLLAASMSTFMLKTHHSYDEFFRTTVERLGMTNASKRKTRGDLVFAFFETHGRWPQRGAEDPAEREAGAIMRYQMNCKFKPYEHFRERVLELDPEYRHVRRDTKHKDSNKDELKALYATTGTLPRQGHPLYRRLIQYVYHDPEFSAWCRERGYGNRRPKTYKKGPK